MTLRPSAGQACTVALCGLRPWPSRICRTVCRLSWAIREVLLVPARPLDGPGDLRRQAVAALGSGVMASTVAVQDVLHVEGAAADGDPLRRPNLDGRDAGRRVGDEERVGHQCRADAGFQTAAQPSPRGTRPSAPPVARPTGSHPVTQPGGVPIAIRVAAARLRVPADRRPRPAGPSPLAGRRRLRRQDGRPRRGPRRVSGGGSPRLTVRAAVACSPLVAVAVAAMTHVRSTPPGETPPPGGGGRAGLAATVICTGVIPRWTSRCASWPATSASHWPRSSERPVASTACATFSPRGLGSCLCWWRQRAASRRSVGPTGTRIGDARGPRRPCGWRSGRRAAGREPQCHGHSLSWNPRPSRCRSKRRCVSVFAQRASAASA